jgi:hypothetical protein
MAIFTRQEQCFVFRRWLAGVKSNIYNTGTFALIGNFNVESVFQV